MSLLSLNGLSDRHINKKVAITSQSPRGNMMKLPLSILNNTGTNHGAITKEEKEYAVRSQG